MQFTESSGYVRVPENKTASIFLYNFLLCTKSRYLLSWFTDMKFCTLEFGLQKMYHN